MPFKHFFTSSLFEVFMHEWCVFIHNVWADRRSLSTSWWWWWSPDKSWDQHKNKRPVVGGAGNIFLYDSSKQKENKNEKHKKIIFNKIRQKKKKNTRHKLCVWRIVLNFLCSLVFGHRRSFFVFPSFVHVIGFQVERLKIFFIFFGRFLLGGYLKKKKKKKKK